MSVVVIMPRASGFPCGMCIQVLEREGIPAKLLALATRPATLMAPMRLFDLKNLVESVPTC